MLCTKCKYKNRHTAACQRNHTAHPERQLKPSALSPQLVAEERVSHLEGLAAANINAFRRRGTRERDLVRTTAKIGSGLQTKAAATPSTPAETPAETPAATAVTAVTPAAGMASPSPTTGSNSEHPSRATRVPNERSVPARVAAEGSRRNATEYRSGSPTSRHDSGARLGDGDATHGSGGRSRGARNEESGRGTQSDDEGDNNSKADSDSSRRGALLSDEFTLTSVPLDTWVGRYVRITTPRHNGTTGLVHRTGNGWVNLQTSLGDVAKRAYDLVVIPEERANISGNISLEKGEAFRGKRYRGSKGGTTGVGSNSGSGDERKPASRSRNSRSNVTTANSTSDSSGQDEHEDDGEGHDNSGRHTRQRGRATAVDEGSDFDEADEADHGDNDEDDGDNDDERYDDRIRNTARSGRPFTGVKPRSVNRSGGKDRFGGSEHMKSSGRMSITYARREVGSGKGRSRAGEHDKMKDRDRNRDRVDHPSKSGYGRDRDGVASASRSKERDSDFGGSRSKRREIGNYFASAADSDDKQASGSCRERVDRSRDKNGAATVGKKDEAVIKSSWAAQMQKAKERPNLVQWRDELVAITKDSSEDFEEATLSVEVMRMRCDVCYHEKSDGDKFCWNADCWMSPVFNGYFKDRDDDSNGTNEPPPQRAGYINTFGRETIIDSALTSALQAPVRWLETKRKRKLEALEVLSEDPALYRWQCWASNFPDPTSKDPTFIDEPRFRIDENEKARTFAPGHARHTSGTRLPPEGKRTSFRGYEDFAESELGTKGRMSSDPTRASGLEALEVAHSRSGLRGSGSGMLGGASTSHKASRAGEEDPRGRRFRHVDGRPMDPEAGEGDGMRLDGGGGRQGVPRRGDVGGGRLWS